MTEINQEIVEQLKAISKKGDTPSQILHKLVDLLPPGPAQKATLIKYMRAAFALTPEQASPIAGWATNDGGELKDSQLDALITIARA